jgi:hypothetical protein
MAKPKASSNQERTRKINFLKFQNEGDSAKQRSGLIKDLKPLFPETGETEDLFSELTSVNIRRNRLLTEEKKIIQRLGELSREITQQTKQETTP